MAVVLKPVTSDNFVQCIKLKVAPEQENFVASNLYSIAQSKVEPECVPLAIYHHDTLVGFAMYALDQDEGKYWIFRLMIDAAHQGKGYGRAAMEALIDRMRHVSGCDESAISYELTNDAARRLYASVGFAETGEVIDGETVARLKLQWEDMLA
jgi:diamine N-acetyltransferase